MPDNVFAELLVGINMAALFVVILMPISRPQMWLGLALIAFSGLTLLHLLDLDGSIIELTHAIAEYIKTKSHK